VRGADTDRASIAPESAGLLAASLGWLVGWLVGWPHLYSLDDQAVANATLNHATSCQHQADN
jgi:hypothetical protein